MVNGEGFRTDLQFDPPSTSVLRQDQEEEEPLWHRHLCGGDSGGRVPPHGQVPQLFQPQVGRGAAPVRTCFVLR